MDTEAYLGNRNGVSCRLDIGNALHCKEECKHIHQTYEP